MGPEIGSLPRLLHTSTTNNSSPQQNYVMTRVSIHSKVKVKLEIHSRRRGELQGRDISHEIRDAPAADVACHGQAEAAVLVLHTRRLSPIHGSSSDKP